MIFWATPQPRTILVSFIDIITGPGPELLSTFIVTPGIIPKLKSLDCNPLPAFMPTTVTSLFLFTILSRIKRSIFPIAKYQNFNLKIDFIKPLDKKKFFCYLLKLKLKYNIFLKKKISKIAKLILIFIINFF